MLITEHSFLSTLPFCIPIGVDMYWLHKAFEAGAYPKAYPFEVS
jgi:hypothetical protein